MKHAGKKLIHYLVPHPLLSLSLSIMWLMLNGLTTGQLLLSFVIALIGGCAVQRLEPVPVKISNWRLIPLLCFRVLCDITSSNLATAAIILKKGRGKAESGFMVIPLDLKDRTALAVLGCILTATPGTAWIAYDTKRSELLLHVLDLMDENYWRQLIKERYETLLLAIFAHDTVIGESEDKDEGEAG